MMKTTIEKSLNSQFQKEYESSYTYLAMAAYLESQGYNGLASWMKQQSAEELGHAMKFYNFIFENNGTVTLTGIPAPKTPWKSVRSVFEAGLKHEQYITKSIDDLINQSIQEKDHASHHFLLGFATEQVEEENTFRDLVRKIEILGDNPMGILMLDKELSTR
jgi:ferritin